MKKTGLIIKIIFLVVFIFYLNGINAQQMVEGLLYFDEKPVSIEIIDGKIAKIKHLPSGSKVPEMYVAPGLIDIQINGYMGLILPTRI